MRNFILLFLLWLSSASTIDAQERLEIVATIPDLGNFVSTIGGEHVKVQVLVPPGNDPHSILPKASLLLKLSRADGLILMGLDYEHAFLPALLEKTRKVSIRPGGIGYMNVGERIAPLEIPETLDRSQGADLHPRGNPHYNLDPENGRIMARAALDLLVALAPQWEEEFQQRFLLWDTEAKARILKWGKWMEPLHGKPVVTYHRSWSYFAKRYGLEVVAEIEAKPGLAPSAKHLVKVKKIILGQHVQMLLMEPWYNEQRLRNLMEGDLHVIKLATTSGIRGDQVEYLDYIEFLVLQMRQAYGLPFPEEETEKPL